MGLRKNFPGNVFHQNGWLSFKGRSKIGWLGKIHQNHTIAAKKLHIGLIATNDPKSSDMFLRPKCCLRSRFKQIEVFCNADPTLIGEPLDTKHDRNL